MDSTTTLSPLALKALDTLQERPMHPYELYQVLRKRRDDRTVKLRPGTLYHAVDKLHGAGLIEAVGTDRDGNRPERTTYRITEAGRVQVSRQARAMLETPVYEYPEFAVALSVADSLDRDEVVAALERRIAVLQDEAAVQDSVVDRLADAGLSEVFVLDLHYGQASVRHEIDWLTDLVARLRSGDLDWEKRSTPATCLLEETYDLVSPLHPRSAPDAPRE